MLRQLWLASYQGIPYIDEDDDDTGTIHFTANLSDCDISENVVALAHEAVERNLGPGRPFVVVALERIGFCYVSND